VGAGFFLPIGLILTLQAVALHRLSIVEPIRPIPGLHEVPLELREWKALGEDALEPGVTAYLKPDEYVLRDYVNERLGSTINVFLAYFKSLQSDYGPHSPRVCLPGNGWLVRSSAIASVQVPGRAESIPVNQIILEKDGSHILVLYWYQNNRDVWAEEFHAKVKLLPDLIRYRRSDVSLIRLITPLRSTVAEGELTSCLDFTKLLFPILVEQLRAGE
jgi:EpsI family protein